jgi:DNA-binding NarL/FixJ family response regulator
MSIRLVLADDHPFILDGLESLFRLEDDIEVVARCTNGDEAVRLVEHHSPDVLILDMKMPGRDGLGVMRALAEMSSPTRVILLAAAISDRELVECIRLGVRGVVLKEMAPTMLVRSVRKVHQGDIWVEKESISRAIELMLMREAGNRLAADSLTPREIEVVRLVAEGLRNKEIAERLTLTEGTIKVHLHNIYQKLGVDGRLELLNYARDNGLV